MLNVDNFNIDYPKKYVSHDYINIDQYVERPKQTKILKNQ